MTRSLCGSSCAIDAGIISLRRAQVSSLVRLTRRAFRGITSFQRDTEGSPRLNADGTPTGSPGDRVCYQGATTYRGDTENSYTYNPNDPSNPIPHRGTRRYQCGTLQRKDIGRDFTDGRRREHLRETDLIARGGDSGGSVFSGRQALGIIVGSTDHDPMEREVADSPSYFAPIERAQDALGGYRVVTR